MANDLPNVARANRALAAVWARGWLPRPRLEAEVLEAVALRGQPRSALGADQSWREPFELLLTSLREEARLNPLGLAMAHGQIVMALRARIRAVRLWRRHLEILDQPAAAPAVILGPMRSGTTRLQRLLACDPQLAHTRLFESMMPVPQPARRLRAAAGLAVLRLMNPALPAIHPTGMSAPEEDFGLYSVSFGSAQFEAQWWVPGFARWWERADTRPLYREFRALLRTIAWSRGGSGRPWVLKAPQFMQDLAVLLETFPDARLICLERNLTEVVPSSASLVWNQMRIQSDEVDKHQVGPEWLRKTRLRIDRARQVLAGCPDVPRIDVSYEAMNADWRAEMRRIYAFLGLELTPALLARMTRYVESAKSHSGHRYSAAEFGLASLSADDGSATPR